MVWVRLLNDGVMRWEEEDEVGRCTGEDAVLGGGLLGV